MSQIGPKGSMIADWATGRDWEDTIRLTRVLWVFGDKILTLLKYGSVGYMWIEPNSLVRHLPGFCGVFVDRYFPPPTVFTLKKALGCLTLDYGMSFSFTLVCKLHGCIITLPRQNTSKMFNYTVKIKYMDSVELHSEDKTYCIGKLSK